MKYKIEPHISAYIDDAVERQRRIYVTESAIFAENLFQRFNQSMKHEIGLMYEMFNEKLTILDETLDFKIRKVTKEVIAEEVTARFDILEVKLDSAVKETSRHSKTLDSHEKRITKLERVTA